jgi:uracil-DNA glycosylase
LAWKSVVRHSIRAGWLHPPHPKFGHGAEIKLNVQQQRPAWLLGCFHPSQQNTFTGRLTGQMLDDVFRRVNILLE